MPAFFSHARGAVSRVDGLVGQGVMPFRIQIANTGIGGAVNPTTRAIITQAAIVENGNFQFLHTLNETIYVYVFGDRIGELRVSGMCFANPCTFGRGAISGNTGMKQIIDVYQANRLAKLGGPVLTSFGETPYRGFLTGMTMEIADPERALGQWAFRFHTFPGGT